MQTTKPTPEKRRNILFIVTDQERYFDPASYPDLEGELPGRARLKRMGVTFTNHNINSSVCTSSRAVLYTGQHITATGMFDNFAYPWSPTFAKDTATLGHCLSECGYYPVYKGKWHLSEEMESGSSYDSLGAVNLTEHIAEYGFNDYYGVGDVIGTVKGGYLNDELVAAQASRWLRDTGMSKIQKGEPWFMAVNFANPHDVMYFNTDGPEPGDGNHQNDPPPLKAISRRPDTKQYSKDWSAIVPLPGNTSVNVEGEGRPAAHAEYDETMAATVGGYERTEARLGRLRDFYMNSIKQTDRLVDGLLNVLADLGVLHETIIVMTADHGELGGAHGLIGKGATAYREQTHVPLIIAHPDHSLTHGESCHAVTSHLDIAPTILNWAALQGDFGHEGLASVSSSEETEEVEASITINYKALLGKDLTRLLDPETRRQDTQARYESGVLYCYNMYSFMDGDFASAVQDYANHHPEDPEFDKFMRRIDIAKKGAIRSIYDGKFKYTRYFEPANHHQPEDVDAIFENNEVELFAIDPGRDSGFEADPTEDHNLALLARTDPKVHKLLEDMNAKLNHLIDAEIGEDNGDFLPAEKDWRRLPSRPDSALPRLRKKVTSINP